MSAAAENNVGLARLAIATWGVAGVAILLGQAVLRLTPFAVEALSSWRLSSLQWASLALWMVFSAWAEGYRGFQLRFSPRVVARAFHLAANPRPLFVVLAPLFCMSFFHATRRGLATAWGITAMVVGFVVAVRAVPQPWRGIIDGGVVLGLTWGLLAIVVFYFRALAGRAPPVDADLPSGPPASGDFHTLGGMADEGVEADADGDA